MSLLVLASAKGSPGVTTLGLGLAWAWPGHRQVVLAELDAAGGDIAARFALGAEPGVASLAAASRRGVDTPAVLEHCQHLSGRLPVLVGPPGADQARRAVAMIVPALVKAMVGRDSFDVIADCGRLGAEASAVELAREASLVLLLSRPDVASLSHVASLAAALGPPDEGAVGLVLVGDGPYPRAEVSHAIGVEVVAVLPHDPDGAIALGGGAGTRAARRLPLLRAIADLPQALAARLPSGTGTPSTASWPPSSTSEPVPSNGARRKVAP